MIKPLVKQNIADEVFRQMFDLIMKKRWDEGEKLPSENELKEMFNVSRNTIRASLNRLSLLGIVETRQGEGNFVKKIGVGLYMNSLIPYIFLNVNDIFTIMEFRMGVELQTARLAAFRGEEQDIEEIRKALEECQNNSDNLESYMTVDMAFHLSIAKASKNDLLYQAMAIIKNYCYAELQNFVTPSIRDKSCYFHQKIFDSIQNHDSKSSMELMNEHLRNVYSQIEEDHNKKQQTGGS